jgi:hypothetical protein
MAYNPSPNPFAFPAQCEEDALRAEQHRFTATAAVNASSTRIAAASKAAIEWLKKEPAGAVVSVDSTLLQQVKDIPNCEGFKTFQKAIQSQKAKETGIIYVLSLQNKCMNVDVNVNDFLNKTLKIRGYAHGTNDGRIGSLVGNLKLSNSAKETEGHVIFEDMMIYSGDHRDVINIGEGVKVEADNTLLFKEDSFNDALVRHPERVVAGCEFDIRVTAPGFLKKLSRHAFGGAIMGGLVYAGWLFVLLFAAGGAITAGPASILFGPMALHWSGTMGLFAFGFSGGILGTLECSLLHALKWWTDKGWVSIKTSVTSVWKWLFGRSNDCKQSSKSDVKETMECILKLTTPPLLSTCMM